MAQNKITKTCINCGLQKPLSAYLQITGVEGSSYGSICSTCRGSGLGKKIVIPAPGDEQSSGGSSGQKMDIKLKIHTEMLNKQEAENQRELAKEDRKEIDSNFNKAEESKTLKSGIERKHREGYLSDKEKKAPSSFLNYQPGIAERDSAHRQTAQAEAAHQEKVINEEIDLTNIDAVLAQPAAKMQSAELQKVIAWLGPGAARRFLSQQKAVGNTDSHQVDNMLKFIEDNFERDTPAPKTPGSRRR